MPHSGSPAVTRPGGIGNRLLAALPRTDFDLLAPDLEKVALDQDAVLSRAGDQIEHVFFPHSGAISLMIDMANGETVATAAVGREGAVGILSVLGPTPSASTDRTNTRRLWCSSVAPYTTPDTMCSSPLSWLPSSAQPHCFSCHAAPFSSL